MEKEKFLELKNMEAGYNETKILHDVSLFINEGEIVALMGPNGAGKSTILKAIFGLIPHTGNIFYEGEKFIRHRIGWLKWVSLSSLKVGAYSII